MKFDTWETFMKSVEKIQNRAIYRKTEVRFIFVGDVNSP